VMVSIDQGQCLAVVDPLVMDRARSLVGHTRVPPSTITVDAVTNDASSEASQRMG
jgi:hypothetical protein